mmetsp:Transcript_27015/g.39508  ORF Transcript_27015/g.39508 Transcript_27015/m.39508 type:complete len:544 (-) Transcript_27015:42-1673(-)|eukprot:CAMPEP_0194030316 /NCGR_PEP_ID=MMETSP0009_2-20130614/3857_1 /TAXON_ID=210454 /ORGANISM="Grammatophora oceanica, Strain CCMP 410" /LENGTH=543 /DNA_ID=CAMNT_0038670251 /DNA_START=166 /DNA_END=1797 /DNA_ORIENTATION=+
MFEWRLNVRHHGVIAAAFLFFQSPLPISEATKHNFAVKEDGRSLIAPIGVPYGFLQGGCFGFDVFDFDIEVTPRRVSHKKKETDNAAFEKEVLKQVDAGFLLKRFSSEGAFAKYEETYLTNATQCIFDYFLDKEKDNPFQEDDDENYLADSMVETAGKEGIFVPMKYHDSGWSSKQAQTMYSFKEGEEGLYVLMYQVCPRNEAAEKAGIKSTFEIDFHYKNTDMFGVESYLPAGEMPLPSIFLYFSVAYFICFLVWVLNIRSVQQRHGGFLDPGTSPQIFPIHHLMSVLLLVKTLSIFIESVRYHFIRIVGHANFWSVVYYIVTFVKGAFLFTVVLLIGSGWSFVKPFLTSREKKIIFVVLLLQVIDNIALVVLASETEGETKYDDWSAVLHLVDIICCCAILIPIVWQVNSLEAKLEREQDREGEDSTTAADANADDEAPSEEAAKTVQKLKQFRSFYLLVIAYIYFTRIAVYLFATILDYKHTWVRYFITETVTLSFYVVTGLSFRPQTEQQYQPINRKDDTEVEIGFDKDSKGVEMGRIS